jgi:hypothetical protein
MSSTPDTPEQAAAQHRPEQEVSSDPAQETSDRAHPGPFDDKVMRRLLHDLDIANDWHAEP